MEYIIHLTDSCNLNCTYCYENKRNKAISFESIKEIVIMKLVKEEKNKQVS